MTHSLRVVCASVALVACPAALQAVLYAQEHDQCTFLCAPELKIEPTFTIENLFNPARVETIEHGVAVQTMRQERDRVFELVVVADVPTEIPRVGFTFEAIFSPFRDDTEVELELELNLTWLESQQTGGWVESHFDIIDKFSPAERPTDTSAYTNGFFTDLSTAPEAAESARDRGQSELVAPWPTSVSAAASVHRACLARGEGRP